MTVGAQAQMRRSFSRPLWRIAALPFVGYLGQTGVALALGAGQDEGLPWLAVVVVLLLLIAAYLCCGLLRDPILGRLQQTAPRGEGPGA